MIPAWQVITWDRVSATLAEFERCVARMRHLGTSTHVDDDTGTRYGQSLWGTEVGGRTLGIAWDWAHVRGDAVALADPMRILSNVSLVGADGSRIDDDMRIRCLNNAVHALKWHRSIAARNADRVLMAA